MVLTIKDTNFRDVTLCGLVEVIGVSYECISVSKNK
jgi:hypothetical protein